MSSKFAHIKNKLKRGGLSRPERNNLALPPESMAIDDRQTKDMLQFVYSFARQVNYFQQDTLHPDSDWLPFFQKSVPFQYAIIAAYDLETLDQQFQQLAASIESRLTFSSLNPLFDLLFALSDQMARWQQDLASDQAGLLATVDSLIETNLRNWVSILIGLANSGSKWGYRAPALNSRQQKVFFAGQKIIPALFAVDRRILMLRGSQKHRVLAAKVILEEIYRVFWKSLEAIVQTAQDEKLLNQTLHTEKGEHLPHLGLLFTFLKLFQQVQGNLNSLSTAHLDFFYRETLQLKALPFVGDQAHVVFELGKQVEEAILIEKGQRFKAGKDANGQDLFFALPEDTIIHKAAVGELKTLFIDQDGDQSTIPGNLQGVYASPVANSADGLGEAFAKEGPQSWPTVGSKKSKFLNLDTQPGKIVDHPEARLGFVVASKVLFLREGERTITLNITLKEDCLANYNWPETSETDDDGVVTNIPELAPLTLFHLYVSTEEGWTKVVTEEDLLWTVNDSRDQLSITFILKNDFPAIMYPGQEVLEENFGYELPMLKAEFNHQITHYDEEDSWYWELRQQEITQVDIKVTVCDVQQLVLQNDLAVLDPNKPFQPFGPLPKAKSSKFYIGSEEIFCKNWKDININIAWKDLPDSLSNHYAGYLGVDDDITIPSLANVQVNLQVLSEGGWIYEDNATDNTDATRLALFTAFAESDVVCSDTAQVNEKHKIGAVNFNNAVPCSIDSLQEGYTNDLQCGFLCIKLGEQDFLHDQYGKVLAEKVARTINASDINPTKLNTLKDNIQSLEADLNNLDSLPTDLFQLVFVPKSTINSLEEKSDDILSEVENLNNAVIEAEMPNPPYTPLIESISLDYCAEDSTTTNANFTHIHPWSGTYEQLNLNEEQVTHTNTLLPCFIDEGTLYVGLKDYQPGSILSLYFEMDPGTADSKLDKATVCWKYLRRNEWLPLQQDIEILSDTTRGLIQSGIVKIAVPAAISSVGTTIMPANQHWLKASVLLRSRAVAETLLISTQAAVLDFVAEENNDLQRLDQSLAAGTVAKPQGVVTGLKGVTQHYPAFGGRAPEVAAHFNLRISEHLRHKGRAITISDYERLVLAQFPQVYRVKCLNHTLGRRGENHDYEMCPGFVTLVVIPNLDVVKVANIFEPRLPAADLQAIKTYLQDKLSPFIHLEVLNPIYQAVKVSAEVKFSVGKSPNFYEKKLQNDLKGFLAPWSGEQADTDISFGGKIFYSSVLHFMENLEYVDTVYQLSLLDRPPQDNLEESNEPAEENELIVPVEFIEATQARSVLTSITGDHDLKNESTLVTSASDPERGVGYDQILK